MRRRYKLGLAATGPLAVLVLMFMWLTGNLTREGKIAPGKHEVVATPAVRLKTLKVSAVAVPVAVEAVGTATARETTEISSRIMANITKVAADAGEEVEKGQTLFVLDSRDARARLSQAREALTSAEAALEEATLDSGRIERLHGKQAATKQEYDRSQASLKVARASVEAAGATVREAKINLSYTRINSPISGKVIDRLADPGDMAMPGNLLMLIYDPSTMRLEISVAEHLRPKLSPGDTVKASLDPPGAEFEGEIVEIVPASDASSRSFIVRVSIPPTVTAYPGMYGRIRLPIGLTEAILIPPDALRRVGQLEMVTVVEDGIARTRAVKIGKTYPGGIEVLSGLAPGELIAVP